MELIGMVLLGEKQPLQNSFSFVCRAYYVRVCIYGRMFYVCRMYESMVTHMTVNSLDCCQFSHDDISVLYPRLLLKVT